MDSSQARILISISIVSCMYKVYQFLLLQLCHDRGYLVTQDELDQTLEQFKEQFGDKPRCDI
jgi:hypothetical protein